MSLTLPTSAQQIFNRIAIDIVNELEELDPFLRNSLIRSISVGFSNAFFELYKTIEQLELLTFWDTTEGESLVRWAAIFGITKNPATIASGFITLTGTPASIIPINAQLTSNTGGLYETTAAATITANVVAVTSIARSGQTATVTTTTDHGLASNQEITIAGANETEYNGTFTVNVTGLDTFEYTVTGSPTTPATGTITVSGNYANIPVQSLAFGADQNVQAGSSMSLSSPVIGVDNVGYVSFDEISGGSDVESDESLRDRWLFKLQNPVALFNENAIIDKARTVSGVTRVFVQTVDELNGSINAVSLIRTGESAVFETATPHGLFNGQVVTVTGANEPEYNQITAKILVNSANKFTYIVGPTPTTPATGTISAAFSLATIGQVRVFFVRDNDVDIIPTPAEVTDVKNAILEIKPAPMSESDLIVSAPTPIVVPFVFSSLNPNTTSMQQAITENLTAFFATGTSVGRDLNQIDYQGVINTTLDSGGNPVLEFTLSSPVGDIPIGANEIPVLGTITF